MSESQLNQSTAELEAAGVVPRRVLGKKLYFRADLARMIEGAPAWRPVRRDRGAPPPTTRNGADSVLAQSFPNLTGRRLRPYKPRRPRTE